MNVMPGAPVRVRRSDRSPGPDSVVTRRQVRIFQTSIMPDEARAAIFLDGRPLPRDPQPSWMGYSVGKWDGDSLVVETIGLRDQGWLDAFGHPHSDALRVGERFRRRDFGHMDIQITIDDPKSYSKPLSYTQSQSLRARSASRLKNSG